ncbi:alpha/beta hydrolase [Dielma fastidiosa]|uniref:alpha/beta hydrolase n=1 Tax=Dielma fastidiosa TaxID=1034346 RepID=UPI000E4CE1A6|nr:alpha/beta hydrolase family protein [Dielma fastidiosa]RHN00885.1 hypothetical protein DWZ33_08620 [Dielma fastidiosa]
MAIFQIHVYSDTLMQDVSCSLILPLPNVTNMEYGTRCTYPAENEKYQVVWLLHSGAGDHTKFIRGSRIEHYAKVNQVAVVMPSVGNSFYCNLPHHGNYYDYYTKELPAIMSSLFPLSKRREDNFIGGISMGGFGAFAAALRNPDQYEAAFSISGALDLDELGSIVSISEWYKQISGCVFGDHRQYYNPSEHDLYSMAMNLLNEGKKIPRLYASSGSEDMYYQASKKVVDKLQQLPIELTYVEGKGAHDWDFWDPQLKAIFEWLKVRKTFVSE